MSDEETSPQRAIKLYQHPLSGHSHRVRLFLSLLELPCESVTVDLSHNEQKSAEFLAINAFGQVPVIDDDGLVLADSNAILIYLAKRYAPGQWWPEYPIGAAKVQRWLSVAAGPLCYGPGLARAEQVFKREIHVSEVLRECQALLSVMDSELASQEYFAGEHPTIADIAMYTYTAHAPEGNISLNPYPNVRAWLSRVESLPGFVPMQSTPVGLCA